MGFVGPYIEKAKASTPPEGFIPNPKLKLLDQVSEVMRFKHYSIRTYRKETKFAWEPILFHHSRKRLSGRAMNSDWLPSGCQATRPSGKTRTITPRVEPRSVFTRSPGLKSAVWQRLSTISTMLS